jgi:CRISPR-associated endoribonuclease Cas6
MPFSINIGIFSKVNGKLPHPCSYMLRDAIASSIKANGGDPSFLFCDDSRVCPIAISTLWTRNRPIGDILPISKYESCRFRVSALDQESFDRVSAPFFMMLAANGGIRLGDIEFLVSEAKILDEENDLASYSDLYEDIGDRVTIRFISPTIYKENGLDVLLPDASLVYGNLWRKWKAFSDYHIDDSVYEEMMDKLSLSKVNIRPKMWRFPNGTQKGFMGSAMFTLAKAGSSEARMLFGGLSRLAFFGGVGLKTTLGLGQCRVFISAKHEV